MEKEPIHEPVVTAIVTYRGVVYPWQCDHMGHMNVMWYVGKFDEATWGLFAAVGLTASHLRDQSRGLVAVEQKITYRRELLAGDTLFVRSHFVEAREKVVRFVHEMVNAESNETAAITELTGVHIDASARRAVPLPEAVLGRLRAMISA
ncbi:MAG: acyl-CoA thioesterase [Deltaproteobacteria bacterium]|nr:acyl-CoA thioesterase [Deltaproteobacteria bacterium]